MIVVIRRSARRLDRAKQRVEPGLDRSLLVGAANAGFLAGTAELINRSDLSDSSNGLLMFGAGAVAAGLNYLLLSPDRFGRTKRAVYRANAAIDRYRPASWIKTALLAGALTVSTVRLSPHTQQLGQDITRLFESPTVQEIVDETRGDDATVSAPVSASRPQIYNQLGHTPGTSISFPGVRLAGKNSYTGRLQRTLRWEPIIIEVERKYGMPHGTLAGMVMQESYGDPVQPNSGGDGGLGLAHIQGTVARKYGLRIHGNSNRDSDHRHGRQLGEMLRDCNWDPVCVQEYDDRGHPIKLLDTAARIVVEGRNIHGSWDHGVEYYRAPGKVGRSLTWQYLQDVKRFRSRWNSKDAIAVAERDFNNRNSGYDWDSYLERFHESNQDWGLARYRGAP